MITISMNHTLGTDSLKSTIDEKHKNESEDDWQDTIQSRLSTIDRKCESVLAEPKSTRVIHEIISHYSKKSESEPSI